MSYIAQLQISDCHGFYAIGRTGPLSDEGRELRINPDLHAARIEKENRGQSTIAWYIAREQRRTSLQRWSAFPFRL